LSPHIFGAEEKPVREEKLLLRVVGHAGAFLVLIGESPEVIQGR